MGVLDLKIIPNHWILRLEDNIFLYCFVTIEMETEALQIKLWEKKPHSYF